MYVRIAPAGAQARKVVRGKTAGSAISGRKSPETGKRPGRIQNNFVTICYKIVLDFVTALRYTEFLEIRRVCDE